MPAVSQPPAFNRAFSFSNFQAANPSLPIPVSQVDGELNNAKASIDGIRNNLALIQRDDGALANGAVTFDTLSPSLQTAGLAPALPWVTGTAYAANASVTHGSAFYRALTTHTAGSSFATDLAAGKWVLIVDFSTIALVAAAMIAVTPSGSLTTNVQTSLQALDTGKAPLSHTQVASTISDSTAAGRALLTAADAAAQQAALGLASIGFVPGNIKLTAGFLESGWYYCDGSTKVRANDAALFAAITIQQTGTLTNSSAVVTGLSDTSNMSPGMPVGAAAGGVQAGTVIQSVDSVDQVTLSLAATATGATALVFAPYGVGDGSTTFGLPNLAYIPVGRDNAGGTAANISQVSTTLSLTSGSATATVTSATGLFVGMYIGHPKVPFGTTIWALVGTTVTMSANATGTVASTGRFSPIKDAQTLGQVGGALSQSTTLVAANIPPLTSTNPSQAISVTSSDVTIARTGSSQSNAGGAAAAIGSVGAVTATGNNSISVTSTGTTSTPIIKQTVQPTIVMNFIIKR
jgi:microcystin-dependent protein